MPRKKSRLTANEIQHIRARWYTFHVNMRAMGRALDPEVVRRCQAAAQILPPMRLRIMGGIPMPDRQAYAMATRIGVDVDLLNEWYLSEAGWENFHHTWEQLPEPFDVCTQACVQVGELFQVIHREEDEDLQKGRQK